MTAVQKYFLKSFCLNFVLVGVISALMSIYQNDTSAAISYLVIYAILGIIITILTVNVHTNKIKSLGIHDIREEHLSVRQERNVKSNLEISEIKEKLRKNHFFDQMTITDIENGIKIKTGLAWNFMDNRITIVQTSNTDKLYQYHISSATNLKWTSLDNGKNLENVIQVAKLIEA